MGSPHAMVAWATTMASHATCAQQPWMIADCLYTEPAARALLGTEQKIKILSSQLPTNTCQPPARQQLNTAFEPMI
jgi:D-alanyl-D-alanine dipeptidase